MKDHFLNHKLDQRRDAGNIRSLQLKNLPYDFTSNDYLGLARNEELFQRIHDRVGQEGVKLNGSGGSRLLSGNSQLAEDLERKLASLFNADAALLFNSGYTANLSLISSVAGKDDTILYDQLAHVCLKEGAWLSRAASLKFLHNDLEDLERKLQVAKGQKFIVTESVFSMDGDEAPIREIVKLAEKYDAQIIIDEAHSTGCYGENGNGWLCEKELESKIFARVYTFGKGVGAHGACVCGSVVLKEYLINFGRSFIYTTALPIHSVITIDEAFNYISMHPELSNLLNKKIDHFLIELEKIRDKLVDQIESRSAIQPIIIPGNDRIKQVAEGLQSKGFDVRPILAPTVSTGEERLRVSLHTFNSEDEIGSLINELEKLI
ncbi:MAG: 8-amino-7-oxononanoate synthase [Cyclobacteriaceae bacterium]